MKDFFKPEDFGNGHLLGMQIRHNSISIEDAAIQANEKLNKLIESWPVVYGLKENRNYWDEFIEKHHTHQARLAFITELPKEPCKHEPMFLNGSAAMVPKCRYCGVELQATWSEVKK